MGGGRIPAHLEQTGKFRGRRGLVGALTLDVERRAHSHILHLRAGGDGGCDGLRQVNPDKAEAIRGVDLADIGATAQVGVIDHEVITHLEGQGGRAIEQKIVDALGCRMGKFPIGT